MALLSVRVLDWGASFAYAPPSRLAVINTDEIVSAVAIDPSRTRCVEQTMRVTFRDGSTHEVVGCPSDLVVRAWSGQ